MPSEMDHHFRASHRHADSEDEGELARNSVLVTKNQDSVEPEELLSPDAASHEVTNVFSHDKIENDFIRVKANSNASTKAICPVEFSNNGRSFVLSQFGTEYEITNAQQASNRPVPRPIAPKLPVTGNGSAMRKSFITEPYKKRDDKRRATHNEIERRRRDKINSWIFKLKELIPDSVETFPADKSKTSANDSKSQILIRACEYIKEMQEELHSLRECLIENDNLRHNNQQLQQEINALKSIASTDKMNIKTEN